MPALLCGTLLIGLLVMKHQAFFLATLESISMEHERQGERLINELDASLESFHLANNWLSRAEAGDATAVVEVLTKYGTQIDAVSLESVQVHVSSAQVQAIVDFLKKWIPKIIRTMQEILERLLHWIKDRLNNLGPRLEKLAKKPFAKTTLTVPNTYAGAAAAGLMLHGSIDKFVQSPNAESIRYVLDHAEGWATAPSSTIRSLSDVGEVRQVMDRAENFLNDWLSFGESGRLYGHGTTTATSAGAVIKERMEQWGHVSDLTGTAIKRWAGTVKMGDSFTMPESSINTVIERLDRLQLNVSKTANVIIHRVERAQSAIRNVGRKLERDKDTDLDEALQIKSAIRLISYIGHAMGAGLQTRLSVLGGAVDILEKAE